MTGKTTPTAPAKAVTKRTTEAKAKTGIVSNVVSASSIKPGMPIPLDYGAGTFSYSIEGKKYIPFLGTDDNLPVLFLESRINSPTHDACITNIANCVVGKGLVPQDVEADKVNKKWKDWIKCVNNNSESLNELLVNSTDGERTQGNQFIEIVRGKLGTEKYIKVYNHSMLYTRLNPDADGVIISRSFAKKGYVPEQKGRVEIPLYNPNRSDKSKNWIMGDNGEERTMIHLKNKVAGVDHYGLPAAKSSLRDQLLEGKIVQYNLDLFNNGMVMSCLIAFKGSMTQDEAIENAQTIIDTHTGDGKQGRVAVFASENGIEDVVIKELPTQKEGSYKELKAMCRETIISANGWAEEFAGGSVSAGLSKGGSYLRGKWDTVEAQTLKPIRKKLISKVVEPLVSIWAEWMGEKEVANYQFDFVSDMPFSFLGELKPEDIMTKNEGRKLANLPERTDGDVYISEGKKGKENVQSQPSTA